MCRDSQGGQRSFRETLQQNHFVEGSSSRRGSADNAFVCQSTHTYEQYISTTPANTWDCFYTHGVKKIFEAHSFHQNLTCASKDFFVDTQGLTFLNPPSSSGPEREFLTRQRTYSLVLVWQRIPDQHGSIRLQQQLSNGWTLAYSKPQSSTFLKQISRALFITTLISV